MNHAEAPKGAIIRTVEFLGKKVGQKPVNPGAPGEDLEQHQLGLGPNRFVSVDATDTLTMRIHDIATAQTEIIVYKGNQITEQAVSNLGDGLRRLGIKIGYRWDPDYPRI